MTDKNVEGGEPDEGVRDLLKDALGADAPRVDVLPGVQRRLREGSGGKFYADAWSTAREPPVRTYLATAALMLAVLVVAWLLLAPLRGRPVRVETAPAPVQVVAP